MTVEAEKILSVFKARGLRAGAMIHPAEFGDAIVWERGFVRDEPVRSALKYLLEQGLLIEHPAAFELTEEGEAALRGPG